MYFDDSYRKYDRTKYPDSQQVFVGNLPSSIVESELTEFFNGKQLIHILKLRFQCRQTVQTYHCGQTVHV